MRPLAVIFTASPFFTLIPVLTQGVSSFSPTVLNKKTAFKMPPFLTIIVPYSVIISIYSGLNE